MTDRPARSETIDINPVADGYVIYDTAADMVHYLGLVQPAESEVQARH